MPYQMGGDTKLGGIVPPAVPVDLLRAMRGVLREIPLWPAVSCQTGPGPRAAFLPSKGREMSSLLRIYAVSAALRHLRWKTAVLPATLTLNQRWRLLSRFAPDFVVMQGARHALNRPGLYPGYRIVYDMDDADFHLPHLAELVSEAMGGVELVLAGSRYVADWCSAQRVPARVVWTGTPPSRGQSTAQAQRGPVVAWAQSAPVDYVEERAFVADVMARVSARRPDVRLRLFGRKPEDDMGILAPFETAGVAVEWLPMMPYPRFLRALESAAVGLSPICTGSPFSRGKSFGKVLAYLDRRVPVVASDEADHALFFTRDTGILSNDPTVWADEIVRLLADPGARQAMADAGAGALRERLSVEAAARHVDRALRMLLGAERRGAAA